jgi:hypothetical protein
MILWQTSMMTDDSGTRIVVNVMVDLLPLLKKPVSVIDLFSEDTHGLDNDC